MQGIDAIFYIAILIMSIVIHEVSHGFMAERFGDNTARNAGRLTLNPIKHLDLFGSILLPTILILSKTGFIFGWAKPVPYNPYNLRHQRWGETLVAIAGVATNILLAIIFGLIVRFSATIGLDTTAISLAATIAFINLFLGLFNLIPFPPLDGFTALRSALPWHLSSGLNRLEHKVRTAGVMSLILFLIVFSYVFATPFFNLVVWLFKLITGSSI